MNTELVSYFRGGRGIKKAFLSFLLSKYYYEELEDIERHALIELLFQLLEQKNLDNIGRKNSLDKAMLYQGLVLLLTVPKLSKEQKRKFSVYCRTFMWPNPEEYYGQKFGRMKHLNLNNYFVQKVMTKTRYPAAKYIGVGYKDKGHKRPVAVDGQLSWQNYGAKTMDDLDILSRISILSDPDPHLSELDDHLEDYLLEW